jgi:uncharacterized protein DUF6165
MCNSTTVRPERRARPASKDSRITHVMNAPQCFDCACFGGQAREAVPDVGKVGFAIVSGRNGLALHGDAPVFFRFRSLPSMPPNVPMTQPRVPISHGELIDKITILEIKAERIGDAAKRANVGAELEQLEAVWQREAAGAADIAAERAALLAVNEALWDIEDRIREKERTHSFDAEFIELARSVYIRNDERAAIKRTINERLGSALVEEKSYQSYR